MQHLLDQLSPATIVEHELQPMIAIKLVLHKNADVLFKPTLPELRDNVLAWVGSCLQVANIVKRLDTEGKNALSWDDFVAGSQRLVAA